MFASIIDQVDGVEDLQRLVRIHRGDDLTDAGEIAIHKFAKPLVVLH